MGEILLEKRAAESLSPDVREAIDLITLDREFPAAIVGSYKYVIHEYPVDIDLFENCGYEGMTREAAVRKIVKGFEAMATRIRGARLTYLADFKAGEDARYETPHMGRWEPLSGLRDYEPVELIQWIRELGEGGLITAEEEAEWIAGVQTVPDYFAYMALEEKIRQKRVIRWTLAEIKKGRKRLAGGLDYSLAEAVQSQSVVKIDIWRWVDGRFLEVTNWYRLRWRQTDGRWTDLTQPLPIYEESIRRGVREFFDPRLEKNIKMAKRIWLYAVYKNDTPLLNLLFPLFRSDAAKLGQVRGEIGVMLDMIHKIRRPPMAGILDQLFRFNEVISSVTQNVIPSNEKLKIFQRIETFYDQKKKKQVDTAELISCLEEIDKTLGRYIQRYVYAFLKKKHLFSEVEKIFAIRSPKAKPTCFVLNN